MKKTENAASRSREEWRGLVQEWKVSGQTAKEFCQARGLSRTCLFHWSSVFKRGTASAVSDRLVPVRVAKALDVCVPTSRVELEVGRFHLRFDSGASPQYVASLARALSELIST